jgi:hypothetical protein
VLLGFNRTLPHLVREFDEILPRGSKLRVVCGEHGDCVEELLHELAPRLAHVTVECDARRPVDLARAGDAAVLDADSVVILGCADETDDNGDARALATLLWLRHTLRAQGRELRRVVTEVRDPRSAAHVRALSHDFVVSTDVVAMLLAQEALDPRVAPVYRELLSPDGIEVFLRPALLYAPAGATFGEVMAAARERGEVALGFYPHAPDAPGGALAAACPTWLNPPRDARVPDDCATQVVVLAPPEGAVRAARAA